MKKHVIYLLAMVMVLAYGCKKEESFELGNTPSEGSLQSDVTGDCLPKTVNGVYVATTPLIPATNTITIQVNVTRTGTYLITTDTVNGYFFRGTGTFTTLGNNNVTLRSNGTPFINGTDNFVVSFNGTICDIAVDVLPAGAGGPATFTLVNGGGPPANCASAVVGGTYIMGTALNGSNYVDIQVNVTAIGTYSITATGGGMTFSKLTAAFLAPGVQTVRLDGSGTPTGPAGPVTVTFAAPFASCSFTVPVTGPAVYTINCPGATAQGSYQVGVALTAGNTVTIPITVTTAGAYSISGTINGMTFSNSGNLTLATTQIILNPTIPGSIPTAAAAPTSNLVVGTPACSIPITVAPAAGPATYTINCPNVTVQGSYQVGVPLTAANTITIPVTVTSAGSYNLSGTINGMTFSNSGNLTLATTQIILNPTLPSTPTAAASPISNLSIGSPACIIPITVAPAPVIEWSFTVTGPGGATYSGATSDVIGVDDLVVTPFTYKIVDYWGEYGGTPDLFNITFGDPAGGAFTAGETYNSNVATLGVNLGYFYFDGLPGIELEATDPSTTPGVNIIFTITSHNTTTKTIIGTFAGTAFDYVSSTNKTITGGTFKIVYPN